MSQTGHRDLEEGNDEDGPNQPPQLPRGEFDYDNNSWPLYSMYSKIAQEEDNKAVEHCQKDVDGTLIFSGLFSATIATLLSVSIPDLKPNSQDTSAFYLANIYGILGNPNASHVMSPSTLIEPPAFSPPGYAIWVNSLWFLSLSLSLAAATEAMFGQSWALRYISVVQSSRHTLDMRARIREIFANGSPGPNIYWGSGYEPLYLHTSVFLFLIGGLIYLFNINPAVFGAVVWFLLIVSVRYILTTVAPIFRPAMLLCSPFTPLALNLYIGILYAVFQVCSCIRPLRSLSDRMGSRYRVMRDRYRKSFESGKKAEAEEIALKSTPQVDARILMRVLVALDDGDSFERFFDSIPGFCNSKLVNLCLAGWAGDRFQQTLNEFLDHTFTSNFVSDSVRSDRVISCLNAAHAALGPDAVQGILDDIFKGRHNEALQSVATGHSLRRWGNIRDDFDAGIRRIVACVVVYAQERDDNWVALVKDEFGIPEGVLRNNLEHGDSVLLAILIHAARQALRTRRPQQDVLRSLSKFDIHNTLPGLQRDFCALWNEIVLEARNEGRYSSHVRVLREIRHAYIALHQGTAGAPTAFSASTPDLDWSLFWQSSYPFCDITSHRPGSTSHCPVTTSPADPPPAQLGDLPIPCSSTGEANVTIGTPSFADPPDTQQFPTPTPTTDPFHAAPQVISVTSPTPESIRGVVRDRSQLVSIDVPRHPRQSASSASETATCIVKCDDPTPAVHANATGESSQAPTLPFLHLNPVPILPSTGPDISCFSEPRLGHALQHITVAATLPHTVESTEQHDIATSCTASDSIQISSTADIPQCPTNGATPRTGEEMTFVPPTIVSDTLSSPIELPVLRNSVSPAELPLSVESSRLEPDCTLYALGSSSSSLTTTRRHVTLHVASNSDVRVSTSIGTLNVDDGTPDLNSLIQMEAISHPNQSAPLAPDIIATLRPEDRLGPDADE